MGHRLATASGTPSGDARSRTEAAALVLTELGGVVDVEDEDGRLVLRGYSCPLTDAVRAHSGTRHATESLLAELVGTGVVERCERGPRPRCRFEIVGVTIQRSANSD